MQRKPNVGSSRHCLYGYYSDSSSSQHALSWAERDRQLAVTSLLEPPWGKRGPFQALLSDSVQLLSKLFPGRMFKNRKGVWLRVLGSGLPRSSYGHHQIRILGVGPTICL